MTGKLKGSVWGTDGEEEQKRENGFGQTEEDTVGKELAEDVTPEIAKLDSEADVPLGGKLNNCNWGTEWEGGLKKENAFGQVVDDTIEKGFAEEGTTEWVQLEIEADVVTGKLKGSIWGTDGEGGLKKENEFGQTEEDTVDKELLEDVTTELVKLGSTVDAAMGGKLNSCDRGTDGEEGLKKENGFWDTVEEPEVKGVAKEGTPEFIKLDVSAGALESGNLKLISEGQLSSLWGVNRFEWVERHKGLTNEFLVSANWFTGFHPPE